MPKQQDLDSFRIAETTLIRILQEWFDREIGEGRLEVVDLDLLKRRNVVEVYVKPGGDLAAAAAATPSEPPGD